ncbi:MAG: DUF262 domain-containing HNH endonuclease family protein [Alphaproteobacteria bacterium]|nr:DUF262 domain-containing HNH endonuclease family protein [Alphaproteobacteria bacterium]
MTSALRCEDVAVGELLSGQNLYEIPAFQRDYSWGETEAQRLYDDIVTACETARQSVEPLPFFLGTMLFVGPDEPQSIVRSSLVIDGQQRLITLTILIAVLRDLIAEPDAATLHARIALQSDTLHVRPRHVDSHFLEHAVQRPGATRLPRGKSDLKPENEPQRRMEAVRGLFAKRLKALEQDRSYAIARFLLEQCRVLRIWAPDIDYAYRLFLSINKPGLPLSDEDIVLAEVIGPLALDQRRRYDTIIAQMSRYREPQPKGRRQDKTFFTHLAVAQRWTRSDRMISLLRRVVAREGGPRRFAATVFEPMAQAYLATRGEGPRSPGSEAVSDAIDKLRVLERFCCSEWVAPAMIALARLRDDEEKLLAYLRALDRFAILLALTRTTADDRRAAYRPVLDLIWQSEVFPDPAVLFALDEQRQAAGIRRIALKLKDAANGADKAVLIRLDAHLSGRPLSNYLDLVEKRFVGENMLTLEHIVPNGDTLEKDSMWRPQFSPIRYRKTMANNIANLVLLEASRNKAAGQLNFADKKQIYFPGGDPHDLYLTDQIRASNDWNRETLQSRYRILMAAALETWGFSGPIPDLPAPPGKSGDEPSDGGEGPPAGEPDRSFRHVRRAPRAVRTKDTDEPS